MGVPPPRYILQLFLTYQSLLQSEALVAEHALEGHQMEDLVDRVVGPNDPHVPGRHKGETSGTSWRTLTLT